jgi:hypothetical protein
MNPAYVQTVIRAADVPFPESFAIVTAYNPNGIEQDEALNLEADQALEQLLKKKRFDYFRCSGEAPKGTWKEYGWGIDCDKAMGISLGMQFTQEAIFWIDSDVLYLIHLPDLSEMNLGSFSTRVHPLT